MMTQEEFMDVQAMKRQGLTAVEIAEATGYHREDDRRVAEKWRPTADTAEYRCASHRREQGTPRASRSCCGPHRAVCDECLRDPRGRGL